MRGEESMYYYLGLSDLKKQAYQLILDSYERMSETIQVSNYKFNEETLNKIFRMILKDHPEIFWLEGSYSYTICQATGVIWSFSPDYRMNIERRNQMRKEIVESEKYFLDGIRFTMTPYEKALRLYENIPRLVTYDHEATVGEKKEKRKKKTDDCSTIYGALVLHKAVCGGYAKAYQYLLSKCGISSIVLDGNTGTGRHSWNLISLEKEWFHVDVTWGDRIKSFSNGYISYAWFCLTDREVLLTRTWDRELPLPSCSLNSQNYYVKNNLYFRSADFNSIIYRVDREIAINKYRKIQLRFAATDTMKLVWNYLINENRIFTLYKKNGIDIRKVWHNMDTNLNVLTFWTVV